MQNSKIHCSILNNDTNDKEDLRKQNLRGTPITNMKEVWERNKKLITNIGQYVSLFSRKQKRNKKVEKRPFHFLLDKMHLLTSQEILGEYKAKK